MKQILLAVALVVSLFAASQYLNNLDKDLDLFEQWCRQYGKYYQSYELNFRYSVFKSNLQRIRNHNQNPSHTYKIGLNQFADLTQDEFINMFLLLPPKILDTAVLHEQIHSESEVASDSNVPNAVDWRGIVKVKDQTQSCGSGWAFAAVSAYEAQLSILQGKNVLLSQQQLMDCDKNSQGCSGGTILNAFKFMKTYGLVAAADYPYVATTSVCKNQTGPFKITNYVQIANETALKKALTSYPVAAGVDAANWQLYTTGVFSNCGTNISHYVMVVGYDDSGNWIVQNSWGTSWGESGHIKLSAGNTCGVVSSGYQTQ